MLMTCWIPLPSWQPDAGAGVACAEVRAPVRAGTTSTPVRRPTPAAPETRRRLVACMRTDMRMSSLLLVSYGVVPRWSCSDGVVPPSDIATTAAPRHPLAVELCVDGGWRARDGVV